MFGLLRTRYSTAKVLQWGHLVAAGVWLALFYPGMTSWKNSITFVIFVSLWANFVSHLGAAAASRAERKADPRDPL